ncbi:MAG: flagellar export protein FliJ [Desulfobacterota bacterium]|nr:flagellar export protein FliJ [Thermodesulfobacteriota bacterium]
MFHFKLSSLLFYRRQLEDMAQLDFSNAVQAWHQETAKLEQYQTLWRFCLEQWRKAQEGIVSIHEIELYQRYMLRLREEIRLQIEKVRQCISVMDEKRDKLLQAQKERKIIEKLHDYEYERYRGDLARREARFHDEISTQRYVRKDNPL